MQGDLLGWAATQVVVTARGHRLPGLATGSAGLSAPARSCTALGEDETASLAASPTL